ncbi:NADP-dependent isocitrate dehydrogenase [Microcella alkaliphila]|uniref:Isocitrate dehydrogenase [NADP] n=1 Tax=Microcella alkaliphila TaxID=279828 RepID=A0A0U5BCC9_9MICO|nr:NADP-dependent isocitrate dehydrogenase [Microcella alkaliphila]BAU33385.1 isocitrate/isopropylmalate dehydrogenase [Microcella alkaliphila]
MASQVTLIPGDGVGPECVAAARRIIDASGAPIEWDEQEAGETVFRRGIASGVPQETIDSITRTRTVLKGPLGTPVGFGEKSANVTLRKLFETYANIRPVRELPGVTTRYSGSGIDLVVVRENVEDLYAGIEHMQTPGVAQCLKLISRKGSEKIVRTAFEYARSEGRRSVACATKSNIMKLTEGELKRTFERIAPEYPDIEARHIIIDNAAHQLVKRPEQFDVIVTTNMNGDILSDLTSALVGGLGFAPSANLGSGVAIFEAVHGSAPKYAGQNVINPTAVILSSVMMLKHLGHVDEAETIENALFATVAAGTLTGDVVGYDSGVSTTDFASAIIDNFGRSAEGYPVRRGRPLALPSPVENPVTVTPTSRRVVGVDVFIESGMLPHELGPELEAATSDAAVYLKMISNRGTKVYPDGNTNIDMVDHYRCRFMQRGDGDLDRAAIRDLLARVESRVNWMHVELLQEFDGEPSFTKAQGED